MSSTGGPPREEDGGGAQATLSIGRASTLSGVPVETIRIWERRYQLVAPQRTTGGHRLYSADDVELLKALKALVAQGHRIGTLADRTPRELLELARRLSPEAAADRAAPSRSAELSVLAEEILEAAAAYDTERAEELLQRPLVGRSTAELIFGLYLPLLRRTGERWQEGQLEVGEEHFLEKLVTGRLHQLLSQRMGPAYGPSAVCACLPGDRHEVGLLASSVLLKDLGFRVTHLGADLPLADLLRAVEERRPALVVLASVIEPSAASLAELTEVLAHPAFDDVAVVAGGTGAKAMATASPRVEVAASLADLPSIAARILTS